MKVLVTGSAGFVGAHLCSKLMSRVDCQILGLDSFNSYYDVKLKEGRANFLTPGLKHHKVDLTDSTSVDRVISDFGPDIVVHLAAQAGVRHSFDAPMDYIQSNLVGQAILLEAIKKIGGVKRLIYASSSSVYSGLNTVPFRETDQLPTPKSLYAATKIADEVLTATYSKLFGIDAIGLRFFTVYGPWGRPDMAYWKFAESILRGGIIRLFNFGDIRRDFTYIDDIVQSIERMIIEASECGVEVASHRVYNIGNNSPEPVGDLISILERQLGERAKIELAPLPPGDMIETYADVTNLQTDYGFSPDTPLEEGMEKFVEWFHDWRHGERYQI